MPDTATIERLMTTREVEKTFRLKHNAARDLCKAGGIRCAQRQRGGKVCYLIAPTDALEQWGPR